MGNRNFLQGALVFLLIVWGSSILLTFFNPHYKPPEGIHGVMTGLAGAIVYGLTKVGNGDDKDE